MKKVGLFFIILLSLNKKYNRLRNESLLQGLVPCNTKKIIT